MERMLGKLSTKLALTAALLLTGCGAMSIPTGTSEEKYLDPNSKLIVATNINDVVFDVERKAVIIGIKQYRLGQLHDVPRYLGHSDAGTSFFLNHSKAKPLSDFKWEPVDATYSTVREVIDTVSIVPPKGKPIEVTLRRLSNNEAELDLDSVVARLKPGVLYNIECPRCLPDLSRLISVPNNFPSPPPIVSESSFSLDASEYRAIQKRVQELKLEAARLKRERELAERKRVQELAQEKRDREAKAKKAAAEKKREQARIAREGDSSPDDLLCKKYGFRPNTQAYANCRMQIDVAKREMQQQQAMYQAQQQQIQQAQEAERKRRQSDFLLGMGLRMMAGQSASGSAIDQSVGAPMYQPPPPSSRTYTFPNGRMMTCTSNGSFTNCY
jgi:flagellar biosynthesis GTPase FlhF